MKNYLEEWMAENFVKIGVPFVFDGIDAKFCIDVSPKEDKYKLFIKRQPGDMSEETANEKVIEGLYAIVNGKEAIYENDSVKCPICGCSMMICYENGLYYARCGRCMMRSEEYINIDMLKKWSGRIKETVEKGNSVSLTTMEKVANILGVKMDEFFAVKRSENGLMVRTFKLDKYGLKNEFGEYNHFALNMLLNGDYEVVR